MSIESLLSQLDRVKSTGPRCWVAKCPAHNDRVPSLSIRELDDGRILIHDFAGCSAYEILSAVGLGFDSLYPKKPSSHQPSNRRPFPAMNALRALAYESLVVAAAANSLLENHPLSCTERQRLMLSIERIHSALQFTDA